MLVRDAMRMINRGSIVLDSVTIGLNNSPPTSVLLVTDVLKSFYATYDYKERLYSIPLVFDEYVVDKISVGTDVIILCHEDYEE